MYVFICENSLEGIFTGVYDACAKPGLVTAISGLPPENRRITSFFPNIFT